MRCLEHFARLKVPYQKEMDEARRYFFSKQDDSGFEARFQARWENALNMEKVGQRSRWNTLRALYILSVYPMAAQALNTP